MPKRRNGERAQARSSGLVPNLAPSGEVEARCHWCGGFLSSLDHIPRPISLFRLSCRCMLDAGTRSSRRRAPCVCCPGPVGSARG